jgi:hypothetical protein
MNQSYGHREAEPRDPLDALLLEEARHIDDAGFTARVIQALPSRPPRQSVRWLVLTAAFLGCCLIGIWALPPIPVVVELVKLTWRNPQVGSLSLLAPLVAAVLALGWTLYSLTADEP